MKTNYFLIPMLLAFCTGSYNCIAQNGTISNVATAQKELAHSENIEEVSLMCIPGCMDPTALNYDPQAAVDCTSTVGGVEVSCCIFPVDNDECEGAFTLIAGIEESWTSFDSSNSGNVCSPTLINDIWYSFTPSCSMEVSITSDSSQGAELAIWKGDCAGGVLTEVACAPNDGFTAVTLSAILTTGITYYIQVGANINFGNFSTGTIELTEGLCRGCIYDFAANYDPTALEDDGSCLPQPASCPGDFDYDGFISVSDLTGFLSIYGGPCE